ncbi:hypothetical protein [Nonomuraea sp. NPDC049784]|uniref:hypothetical protein n=1 Tax=Nonomuraea sp. NPDC049784 TaxID=3154361 RepID=UPI00340CB857
MTGGPDGLVVIDDPLPQAYAVPGTTAVLPLRALPAAVEYTTERWADERAASEAADKGGIYMALGIHGQLLLVHEEAEVVIAKFSSWPEPWIDDLTRTSIETCIDISVDI